MKDFIKTLLVGLISGLIMFFVAAQYCKAEQRYVKIGNHICSTYESNLIIDNDTIFLDYPSSLAVYADTRLMIGLASKIKKYESLKSEQSPLVFRYVANNRSDIHTAVYNKDKYLLTLETNLDYYDFSLLIYEINKFYDRQ